MDLKRRLDAAGIPAGVHNERKLQRFWFLAKKPYASVQLQVAKEQMQSAQETLREWQTSDGALHDAIRCPSCGSLRVEYPQMTRKFVLPTLVAHVLHFLGLLDHKFYCDDCQLTWSAPTKMGWRGARGHEHAKG
jgi:hypothetical protein